MTPEARKLINHFQGGVPVVSRPFEHRLNLWFVIAAESLEHKSRVLAEMSEEIGYPLLDMPKLREYFVQLTLEA